MALVVTSAPFQQVNMPALDLRRTVGVGRSEGVVAGGDMAVAQRAAGANLSVDIAAGEAYVQGDAITNQGMYYAYNDAVSNLATFTAAHATLPRIDRVALRVRDAFHGDAANDEAFVVVTGTATSGATLANLTGATAVPANHLLLANVLIPAAATSITTANIDTTVRARTISLSSPLFDLTLTASAATIQIPSIPSTYASLVVEVEGRSDAAATLIALGMRLNNDTAANYDHQYMQVSGTAVTGIEAFAGTYAIVGYIVGTSSVAGHWGVTQIVIPNYVPFFHERMFTSESFAKWNTTTATMARGSFGGSWRSGTAISSVTLLPTVGNFVSGTRVTARVRGA